MKVNFNEVNEYKELCNQANDMCYRPTGTVLRNGWCKKESYHDEESNCKVVLYERNGHYALCYVGTDKKKFRKDWSANLKMFVCGKSKQIDLALYYTAIAIKKYELDSSNTVCIGHSEGGTEATFAGINNNFQTVTFNTYGIYDRHIDKDKSYADLVMNFRDPHDPVSKIKGNIGTTYITPNKQSRFKSTSPFGSIEAHGIENMGDCTLAVPIEEYKETHPGFLDNIIDAAITAENVGDLSGALYDLYEDEINRRLEKGQIRFDRDIRHNGTVKVSSYHRDDGTLVHGYYRRLPNSEV